MVSIGTPCRCDQHGVLRSTDFGKNGRGQRRIKRQHNRWSLRQQCYLLPAPQSSGVWRRPLSELIVTDVKDQPRVTPTDFTLVKITRSI